MDQSSRPVALVTGASAGIGLELAKVFARRYDLVLVARREDRLQQLADELQSSGCTAHVVVADLARREAPQEIFDRLQRDGITIDVLVNNAGFATYGPFAETEITKELDLIQVNITALTHLTKLFLPSMLRRKNGKILNVASTAAFQPGPLMAVYYASKAYVLHFTEALAEETIGSGVTVTALCPGATTSEFQQRADMENSRLMQGDLMPAREVALAGYRGLMRRQRIVTPGRRAKLFTSLVRVLPRNLTTRIVRRVQEPE